MGGEPPYELLLIAGTALLLMAGGILLGEFIFNTPLVDIPFLLAVVVIAVWLLGERR